ncbi:alpha/beta fold hydrolase [Kineosporia rhizophila]|uniref:thioesterase II family protein n=1 Tax=Kineosporia TaxID=49184 RepID=UPI001E39170E|nr:MULTISPECIES: alpha/beta fold hydrolase [Kineosporia]MCE0537491.1 alpha/beta fold hydrolase [Kineosporia rhizophila]GLY16556.1 thioesterase [Kineosporia sp. NBRC 101677]
MSSQPSGAPEMWLRRYRPSSTAAARLVCLPHAGGSASFFVPVAASLSPHTDVVAVQYPGRQDRRAERPIPDIAVLAQHVHRLLSPMTDLPLFLFGHSMGASLAFEVARLLEASGHPGPARVFASGRRAPSVYREERVHQLDDNGLLAEIRSLDGTSALVLNDDELMRAALPALRADYQAAELYQGEPGATIKAPVTVLTGDADPKTSLDDAKAWADHTTGDFDLQVFPGGHFFLTDQTAAVMRLLEQQLRG